MHAVSPDIDLQDEEDGSNAGGEDDPVIWTSSSYRRVNLTVLTILKSAFQVGYILLH